MPRGRGGSGAYVADRRAGINPCASTEETCPQERVSWLASTRAHYPSGGSETADTLYGPTPVRSSLPLRGIGNRRQGGVACPHSTISLPLRGIGNSVRPARDAVNRSLQKTHYPSGGSETAECSPARVIAACSLPLRGIGKPPPNCSVTCRSRVSLPLRGIGNWEREQARMVYPTLITPQGDRKLLVGNVGLGEHLLLITPQGDRKRLAVCAHWHPAPVSLPLRGIGNHQPLQSGLFALGLITPQGDRKRAECRTSTSKATAHYPSGGSETRIRGRQRITGLISLPLRGIGNFNSISTGPVKS